MSVFVKTSSGVSSLDLSKHVSSMINVGYQGQALQKIKFSPNEIEGFNHLLSGCWATGWYEYGGYLYDTCGAPDNWAGIMLVFARRYLHSGSPDYNAEGYTKIAFTCGCYIYMCTCDETGKTAGWRNVAKPL